MDDNLDNSVFYSEEDSELDSRVKNELESLNFASESINKLENEVQKARNKFKNMKTDASQQLNTLYKKIGRRFIIKTRTYYDLIQQCSKLQSEVQRASLSFQKANGMYKAAKETVTLAECQLISEDGRNVQFDSAWQELLNHANLKFGEAEKEKRQCEEEHSTKSAEFVQVQNKMTALHKDMPRAIAKAKPFYDLKRMLELRLKAERQNAEDLHLALFCSKQKYKMALQSLEQISEQVHQQRQISFQLPMRTPGVGAECDTVSQISEMPSANLDIMSEAGSQISNEDLLDLDIELSLSEMDSNENQSSDELSAFDFWSKFSSRLKTAAPTLPTLPTNMSETRDRRDTIVDRSDPNEHIRRDTIIDRSDFNEHLIRDTMVDRTDPNEHLRRDTMVDRSDLNEQIKRNTMVDRSDLNEHLRRDTMVDRSDLKEHLRRDTMVDRSDFNEQIKRNTIIDRSDLNEQIKRNTIIDRSNLSEHIRRNTVTEIGDSDADDKRRTLTAESLELAQREFMVEGAEGSIAFSDSSVQSKNMENRNPQLLSFNGLNSDNILRNFTKGNKNMTKIVDKPPVAPPMMSSQLRSGIYVPVVKSDNQSMHSFAKTRDSEFGRS